MVFPAELQDHVQRIAPTVLAAEQVLPVPAIFDSLLPGRGLQRGWTARVDGGPPARALAWAMLSEVTAAGGWIAAVDVSGINLEAAREVGVAIERVLVVTSPDRDSWSATIGALIGAVDVIVFGSPKHRVQPREHRRMASRCRERGTVLVELAGSGGQLQYDVSFDVTPAGWSGLGRGFGRLHARRLEVSVAGRRVPGGSRGLFELPAADGTLRCLQSSDSLHSSGSVIEMDQHRRSRSAQ